MDRGTVCNKVGGVGNPQHRDIMLVHMGGIALHMGPGIPLHLTRRGGGGGLCSGEECDKGDQQNQANEAMHSAVCRGCIFIPEHMLMPRSQYNLCSNCEVHHTSQQTKGPCTLFWLGPWQASKALSPDGTRESSQDQESE